MADKKTELDLDINNYDLQDILVLFDIPMNFNEADLKRAKQMVLRTHPDKSKLSPEYFRFYSNAYKTLFSVWEFRKKGDVGKDNQNTEYVTIVEHDEKGKALGAFFDENSDLKKPDNFNEIKSFRKLPSYPPNIIILVRFGARYFESPVFSIVEAIYVHAAALLLGGGAMGDSLISGLLQ